MSGGIPISGDTIECELLHQKFEFRFEVRKFTSDQSFPLLLALRQSRFLPLRI